MPHAAERRTHPALCSLTDAATREPIHGVLGLSLHMNLDSGETWIVAEQLVDDNAEPLKPGIYAASDAHPEYFKDAVRTALFRYPVYGFTTGPLFDRTTGWHPALATAQDDQNTAADTKAQQVFRVRFRSGPVTRKAVVASYFDVSLGFVRFYDGDGGQVAAYAAEDVSMIDVERDTTVLVLEDATQRRALRSAVAWELERTAQIEGTGYRHQLARLAGQLGVPQAGDAAESAEANESDVVEDDDANAPNQRIRDAVQRRNEDLLRNEAFEALP